MSLPDYLLYVFSLLVYWCGLNRENNSHQGIYMYICTCIWQPGLPMSKWLWNIKYCIRLTIPNPYYRSAISFRRFVSFRFVISSNTVSPLCVLSTKTDKTRLHFLTQLPAGAKDHQPAPAPGLGTRHGKVDPRNICCFLGVPMRCRSIGSWAIIIMNFINSFWGAHYPLQTCRMPLCNGTDWHEVTSGDQVACSLTN